MPGAASLLSLVLLMAPASDPSGGSIPTLSFNDANGKLVKLDAPGVLYFVNFWMPNCQLCELETPDFERLSQELASEKRVRFINVLWTGTGDSYRLSPSEAKRAGLNLPLYTDPKKWKDELGVDAVPAKFLIRDGKILRFSRGADERPYEHWKWLIGRELEPDEEPKAP